MRIHTVLSSKMRSNHNSSTTRIATVTTKKTRRLLKKEVLFTLRRLHKVDLDIMEACVKEVEAVDKSSFLAVYVSSCTYTCRLHKTPEHGWGSSKQEIKAIISGEFAHMELHTFYAVISMDSPSLSHTRSHAVEVGPGKRHEVMR